MSRDIIVSDSNNPAKNFGGILKDLEKVAKKNEIPMEDAIKMLIADIKNLSNPEYEKKVKTIVIKGELSENIKNELISYLNRALKKHNKSAQINKVKEQQKNRRKNLEELWKSFEQENLENCKDSEKIEVIKRLIAEINEGTILLELKNAEKNYMLKKLKELVKVEEKNVINQEKKTTKESNKMWNEIVEIINKEAEKTGKNKLVLWEKIKSSLCEKDKRNILNLDAPDSIKENIINLVDERIKEEGLEYYEEVKRYTHDLDFLTGFRGVSFAIHGHRNFSNSEHGKMFEDLVGVLRKNENVDCPEEEDIFLKRVLKEEIVNTYYGIKIIQDRIDRIEKDNQYYFKRKINREER